MHSYAQTNVQLFDQLRNEGYSQEERERVCEAYYFGMSLFTGLFLPSGKTFIDHLVGTASILAALRASIDIVVAGLIHAAYLHGDFGRPDGICDAKRQRVRDAVGEKVEAIVARYDGFVLSSENAPLIRDSLDRLSPMERDVLLMRLANELEHNLDRAPLYYVRSEGAQRWYQKHLESYGPVMEEMAEKLGYHSLSVEIAAVRSDIISAKLPVEPWIRDLHPAAYLVVPRSYRERFGLKLRRGLLGAWRWISRQIDRFGGKFSRLARRLLRTAT